MYAHHFTARQAALAARVTADQATTDTADADSCAAASPPARWGWDPVLAALALGAAGCDAARQPAAVTAREITIRSSRT